MKQALSAKFCEHASKPTGAKDQEIYWDTQTPSFGLRVTKAGVKSWVCQYRINGKSQRETLKFIVPLADARKWARETLVRAETGVANETFGAVVSKYLAHKANMRSYGQYHRMLERLILPALKDTPMTSLGRRQIMDLMDTIKTKNGAPTARLAFGIVRGVLSWHETRSDNFTTPLARKASVGHANAPRTRFLADDEMQALWAATERPEPFYALVRFLLLTGVRRTEALGMRWGELDGDTWVIPARRMKGKQEHYVQLSVAALDVLRSLPRLGPFVFSITGQRPIGAISDRKARLSRAIGFDNWTLHDLRRTCRTLMSRAKVQPHIAEICLAHAQPTIVKTYDRYTFADEKRAAWAAVSEIVLTVTAKELELG